MNDHVLISIAKKIAENANLQVITQATENWLDAHPEATTTVEDGAISYTKLNNELKGKIDEVSDLKSGISITSKKQALLHDNVPGTIQTYYFTDGPVSKIEHKSGTEIIRTDVYSYDTSTITETRTLNTGETLTIITNLNTLETSVAYNAD